MTEIEVIVSVEVVITQFKEAEIKRRLFNRPINFAINTQGSLIV